MADEGSAAWFEAEIAEGAGVGVAFLRDGNEVLPKCCALMPGSPPADAVAQPGAGVDGEAEEDESDGAHGSYGVKLASRR